MCLPECVEFLGSAEVSFERIRKRRSSHVTKIQQGRVLERVRVSFGGETARTGKERVCFWGQCFLFSVMKQIRQGAESKTTAEPSLAISRPIKQTRMREQTKAQKNHQKTPLRNTVEPALSCCVTRPAATKCLKLKRIYQKNENIHKVKLKLMLGLKCAWRP